MFNSNEKKNITNKTQRIKWGRTKKKQKLTQECYPLSETREEIYEIKN